MSQPFRMKYAGWGDPSIEFPVQSRPKLWPWLCEKMRIVDAEVVCTPAVALAEVKLSPSKATSAYLSHLANIFRAEQFSIEREERIFHAYGKSYMDLLRMRRGEVRSAPDVVIYPESHEEVVRLTRLSAEHNVVLIPFGGGTNIVGCVENLADPDRCVTTVDLCRMNRVRSLDAYSQTALIECGARGPEIEQQLAARGFSLGHFPDSFEYSTLGGWIATRSAGMQSDAYGRIEDMVVALRVVTAKGEVETLDVPVSSAGPDLKRLFIGSEGTLGIITEATMRVHAVPNFRDYRGYLFRTFEEGVAAMHDAVTSGQTVSMFRLQDSRETELALQLKGPSSLRKRVIKLFMRPILQVLGYREPCVLVAGVEGEASVVSTRARELWKHLRRCGGFPLGKNVGQSWSADKFLLPYLRDYLMERACLADVSETTAKWSNVVPLYHETMKTIERLFAEDGQRGFLGCHISHTYHDGACLYFTYATKQQRGFEAEQYARYKTTLTQLFSQRKAALSHHHAVGYEHLPWMEQELSEEGVRVLREVKQALDPRGMFNPRKLIPLATSLHDRARANDSGVA